MNNQPLHLAFVRMNQCGPAPAASIIDRMVAQPDSRRGTQDVLRLCPGSGAPPIRPRAIILRCRCSRSLRFLAILRANFLGIRQTSRRDEHKFAQKPEANQHLPQWRKRLAPGGRSTSAFRRTNRWRTANSGNVYCRGRHKFLAPY
jgi:hypothetical protein